MATRHNHLAGKVGMASSVGSIRCALRLVKPQEVRYEDGQLLVVPGAEVVDFPRVKQPPHVSFSNLLDSDKAVAKFLGAWGPLLSAHRVTNYEAQQVFIGPAQKLIQDVLKVYPTTDVFFRTRSDILHF